MKKLDERCNGFRADRLKMYEDRELNARWKSSQ
jgi:hypothetical protein